MKIYQDEYYLDNMILGMKNFSSLHRYAVNGKTSGNLACIAEIKNALVVMCSPRGCGFHYRYHARARHRPYSPARAWSSNLKPMLYSFPDFVFRTRPCSNMNATTRRCASTSSKFR